MPGDMAKGNGGGVRAATGHTDREARASAAAPMRPSAATSPRAAPPARAPAPAVAVVGAGVVGLATACRLADALPRARVALIAASAAHTDTTSWGAAGLWTPFKLGATDPALVNRWGSETLDRLQAMALSKEAGVAGVMEHSVTQLWTKALHGDTGTPPPRPPWSPVAPAFRDLTRADLARHEGGGVGPCVSGWAFDSVTAQPARYLPWLEAAAAAAGVERRYGVTLQSLTELAAEFDAVVNCAGLGARALAADAALVPVRGQVVRVAAPWVQRALFVDEVTYVIPNCDWVVCGGSATAGDERTRVDDRETQDIMARCAAALPSLATAPVLGAWAGLRPVRSPVRVEAGAPLPRGRGLPPTPLVHCVGHGGSGVTLHWGCAGDAVRLVVEALAA